MGYLISNNSFRIDGGEGSGNFGHSGRPGHVGGSGGGGLGHPLPGMRPKIRKSGVEKTSGGETPRSEMKKLIEKYGMSGIPTKEVLSLQEKFGWNTTQMQNAMNYYEYSKQQEKFREKHKGKKNPMNAEQNTMRQSLEKEFENDYENMQRFKAAHEMYSAGAKDMSDDEVRSALERVKRQYDYYNDRKSTGLFSGMRASRGGAVVAYEEELARRKK